MQILKLVLTAIGYCNAVVVVAVDKMTDAEAKVGHKWVIEVVDTAADEDLALVFVDRDSLAVAR